MDPTDMDINHYRHEIFKSITAKGISTNIFTVMNPNDVDINHYEYYFYISVTQLEITINFFVLMDTTNIGINSYRHVKDQNVRYYENEQK
jgi:hypothetical protein